MSSSSIAQLTMQCMLPGHYYRKYLAKLESNEEIIESLQKDNYPIYHDQLIEICHAVLNQDASAITLPVAILEKFGSAFDLAIDYLSLPPKDVESLSSEEHIILPPSPPPLTTPDWQQKTLVKKLDH